MADPGVKYTDGEIDDALTAVLACSGNISAAIRLLKEDEKRAPTPTTLVHWIRVSHWERYADLREKFAPRLEEGLANDYLDRSRRAAEVLDLALAKAEERLESGKDEDPGKTAANLARVATNMTDKRLALQGRPTRITETRDVTAVVQSLLGQGILHLAQPPAELEEGKDGDSD